MKCPVQALDLLFLSRYRPARSLLNLLILLIDEQPEVMDNETTICQFFIASLQQLDRFIPELESLIGAPRIANHISQHLSNARIAMTVDRPSFSEVRSRLKSVRTWLLTVPGASSALNVHGTWERRLQAMSLIGDLYKTNVQLQDILRSSHRPTPPGLSHLASSRDAPSPTDTETRIPSTAFVQRPPTPRLLDPSLDTTINRFQGPRAMDEAANSRMASPTQNSPQDTLRLLSTQIMHPSDRLQPAAILGRANAQLQELIEIGHGQQNIIRQQEDMLRDQQNFIQLYKLQLLEIGFSNTRLRSRVRAVEETNNSERRRAEGDVRKLHFAIQKLTSEVEETKKKRRYLESKVRHMQQNQHPNDGQIETRAEEVEALQHELAGLRMENRALKAIQDRSAHDIGRRDFKIEQLQSEIARQKADTTARQRPLRSLDLAESARRAANPTMS